MEAWERYLKSEIENNNGVVGNERYYSLFN